MRWGPTTTTARDILVYRPGTDSAPRPLIATPANEHSPRLSPDGRVLAYVSSESGRDEVYLRPFPEAGTRIQVSADGGTMPVWSGTGELFYRSARDSLMAVSVSRSGGGPNVAKRQALFSMRSYLGDASHPTYDVGPDGRRFLMIRLTEQVTEPVVVLNWVTELKQRMTGQGTK